METSIPNFDTFLISVFFSKVSHPFHFAIGTEQGLALVYGATNQKFKSLIGTKEGITHGPVTSIALSRDGNILACGHKDGSIVIWDLPTKSILKTLTCHKEPVVSVKFVKSDICIVSADAKGAIFYNTLSSMLFTYWTSTTEVRAESRDNKVEPFLAIDSLGASQLGHPTEEGVPIAFATSTETLIYTVDPLVHIGSIPRPDSASLTSMPFLSWLSAATPKEAAILAIGWGTNLFLFSFSAEGGKLKYKALTQATVEGEVNGMAWLGKVLLLLSSSGQLLLFNPFDLITMERRPFNSTLVAHDYFARYYSSTSRATHNSILFQQNTVFLLTPRELFSVRILQWEERVKVLIDNHQWLDALSLSFELYDGKVKDVYGGDPIKMKKKAIEKFEEIFPLFIYDVQTSSEQEDFRILASVCIDYCQKISRRDLLFGEIYQQFIATGQQETFLEMLEPFIFSDKLTYVDPEVMNHFIDYFKKQGFLKRVERCIIHLDTDSLDFESMEAMCRKNNLHCGLIYIANRCNHDYLAPMQHLIGLLKNSSMRGLLGYLLLIYLSRCLSGKAFPSGIIEPSQVQKVKVDILTYLFTERVKEEDKKFPYLHVLLEYDTKKALEVLSIAFLDKSLSEEEVKVSHAVMFHALQQIFIDKSVDPYDATTYVKSSAVHFSVQKVLYFLMMAAKHFSSGTINLSDYLLDRIIGALTLIDDESTFDERQQCLLKLIKYCPANRLDEKSLVSHAKDAEFHEVTEWYKQQNFLFLQVGFLNLPILVSSYFPLACKKKVSFETEGLQVSDFLGSCWIEKAEGTRIKDHKDVAERSNCFRGGERVHKEDDNATTSNPHTTGRRGSFHARDGRVWYSRSQPNHKRPRKRPRKTVPVLEGNRNGQQEDRRDLHWRRRRRGR